VPTGGGESRTITKAPTATTLDSSGRQPGPASSGAYSALVPPIAVSVFAM
jgi:hypothetical protein